MTAQYIVYINHPCVIHNLNVKTYCVPSNPEWHMDGIILRLITKGQVV